MHYMRGRACTLVVQSYILAQALCCILSGYAVVDKTQHSIMRINLLIELLRQVKDSVQINKVNLSIK